MPKKRSNTSAPTSKSNASSLKPADYEQLGRVVASVYETGYLTAGRSFKMSFLKGVAQGFGGIIGATIVVALLLWLLSLLDTVPFAGGIVDNIKETIDNR